MFHLVIATALQLKKAAGMLADGAVPEPATPKARPPCGQFGPPPPPPQDRANRWTLPATA